VWFTQSKSVSERQNDIGKIGKITTAQIEMILAFNKLNVSSTPSKWLLI
jgi:hypothetical protein